jgi:O-antigen/teichoic acid export membrane protein
MMNRKFTVDLSFNYAFKVATFLVTFSLITLINSHFGVHTYGQLVLIISAVGFCSNFVTARSSEAITRFYTRELLNNHRGNAKYVLALGCLVDLITAPLLLGIVYLTSDLISLHLLKSPELSQNINFYAIAVFFSFLKGTILGFYQSRKMFITMAALAFLEPLFQLLLVGYTIWFKYALDLGYLIYAHVIASAVAYCIALTLFLYHAIKTYRLVPMNRDQSILSEYISFSIRTFVSSTLKAGNQNIDTLMLGYFCNPSLVGIYQVLKKVMSPVFMISAPLPTLFYPKLVELFEMNRWEKIVATFRRASIMIFGIAILYSCFAFIVLPYIMDFCDLEYNQSILHFFLLLVANTILTSQMWWVRIFSNTTNPIQSIIANVFATVFQLTVVLYLSYQFNLYGILAGLFLMNVLLLLYWFSRVKVHVPQFAQNPCNGDISS